MFTPPKQRRHPALVNTVPGVWCPEAVGKVPGYLKTPEAHAKRVRTLKVNSDKARSEGRTRRTGIPNGWGGKRDEIAAHRQEAADKAWACVRKLNRNSFFEDERLEGDQLDAVRAAPATAKTDAERGALAISFMIEVILSPTYSFAFRTAAARALLPYLRTKPVAGATNGPLSEATAFFDSLIAETSPAN